MTAQAARGGVACFHAPPTPHAQLSVYCRYSASAWKHALFGKSSADWRVKSVPLDEARMDVRRGSVMRLTTVRRREAAAWGGGVVGRRGGAARMD
jgi:hypothetical protein